MKYEIWELGEGTGICVIEDFLSPRECAALIRTAKRKGLSLKTFEVKGLRHAHRIVDKSVMVKLRREETETLRKIHERIEKLTHFPKEHAELLSVVCYKKGGSLRHPF